MPSNNPSQDWLESVLKQLVSDAHDAIAFQSERKYTQALTHAREAINAHFEAALGAKEDSYVWHTADASLLNHMRVARNEMREDARNRWYGGSK